MSVLKSKKVINLPQYDIKKKNLPKRTDYIGAKSWLRAVQKSFGEEVIFALDEALMCKGSFGGRSDEFIVWVYGSDRLSEYNGVVILGDKVDSASVETDGELFFTDFNRTLCDAISNESVLDMQGITEALSMYYYTNGDSFKGLSIPSEYELQFKQLADDAVYYYAN